MEFPRLFLSFANVHPIVAAVLAVCGAVVAIVVYKLAALVLDSLLSLVGRPRTVRVLRERIAGVREMVSRAAQSAGTESEEYEPAAQPVQPRGRGRAAQVAQVEPASEDDVRSGLEDLGYTAREVKAVMPALDLSMPTAEVLRAAIRKLSGQRTGVSA